MSEVTDAQESDDDLLVTDEGRVRVVTLNRPHKRNALNAEILDGLDAAISSATTDPTVSVVLLRHAGDHFCSGYDMGGVHERKLESAKPTLIHDIINIRESAQRWQRMWTSGVPIVVGIRGYCLAGGTDLAFHADAIICGESARFGFPAVRYQGVPPTQMWVAHLGLAWAKRLLLTGDYLSGATAARLGLALECLADDAVDDAAMALAQRMALVDKELLMSNKVAINLMLDVQGRAAAQQIAAVFDGVGHSANSVAEFWTDVKADGLAATWRERNDRFGDQEAL